MLQEKETGIDTLVFSILVGVKYNDFQNMFYITTPTYKGSMRTKSESNSHSEQLCQSVNLLFIEEARHILVPPPPPSQLLGKKMASGRTRCATKR